MVTSCVQNGPPARREEGPYLNRYVTDEQRGRQPIFNATLRAAASWLFFRVARSARMTQIWVLRSRLEKQPTDLRRRHHYMRDGALAFATIPLDAHSSPLRKHGQIPTLLLSCRFGITSTINNLSCLGCDLILV